MKTLDEYRAALVWARNVAQEISTRRANHLARAALAANLGDAEGNRSNLAEADILRREVDHFGVVLSALTLTVEDYEAMREDMGGSQRGVGRSTE